MNNKYTQFENDSIVYSLFNNSSQQSSLRQVQYKDKLWDIKNEFFWLSKDFMMELAIKHNFKEMIDDINNDKNDDRYVYKKLQEIELSPDAKEILNSYTELLIKSMDKRKEMNKIKYNPERHLYTFDAGYAQLKLVWKEYFKEEFNKTRELYNEFEKRLRPLVYELGFLKHPFIKYDTPIKDM